MLPSREELRVCFAHPAYRLKDEFDRRNTGIDSFMVETRQDLESRIGEADVLVVSGLWQNSYLAKANRLKFIQSVSSGTNQYDLDALKKSNVLLASAQGVNMNAVAVHAMSLILAMARRLPEARDNQAKRFWRPMSKDISLRENEISGQTILIVGLGRIGDRLAELARVFGMHVIGVRRNIAAGAGHADEVHSFLDVDTLIPRADFVVLTCPLTEETRNIISAASLKAFRDGAILVNMARGACVDEAALIEALEDGRISGAALDVTQEEPLPGSSPLWSFPNVFITPHTGGETRNYERNLIDLLIANLEKLGKGDTDLTNRIV